MRRWMAVVIALVLVTPAAWSANLSGVDMDDTVMVDGKELKLNGMGLRKKSFFKIYVAGLYLEQKSGNVATIVDSKQVKRVVMHFTSGLAKKKKMDAAWAEGFKDNSPKGLPALMARVETFKGFFGNMDDGDIVVMTMVPDKGTEVMINDKVKGTIEGDDFAAALLRVWLGPKPPTNDLKDGMLGKL